MDTPAGLFDSYSQDYDHTIKSIRTKLEVEAKDQFGEQRKATLRRVEVELDEADDIISQLEYSARLKQAKTDLNRFKKLSKDLHSQSSRTDLLGAKNRFRAGPTSDDPYGEQNDRTRLLAGTEILSDGTRRLEDSRRIALETESQGADIMRNLRQQREQMENARDTVQMYKQRFILGALVAVLIIVVILILYFKLVRH
ncbi:vesicle transport v-snare protein vti1 [Hymenopellis radicata]|nr:vesicle transport v-snare protein vti1 [Hymenopellis radicata]